MPLESSRLLATYNGLDYYTATSEDQKMACLFTFSHESPGESVMSGRGGLGEADFCCRDFNSRMS